MSKKICLNDKSKCFFLVVSFIAFLWVIFYYWNFSLINVNANPDYICVKSVTDSPCNITSCWNWNTDGTRVCTWKKTTSVAYYLRRTTCESWYSRHSRGSDSWWSSWRQSWDYVYSSSTCTVTQVDRVAPSGEIK